MQVKCRSSAVVCEDASAGYILTKDDGLCCLKARLFHKERTRKEFVQWPQHKSLPSSYLWRCSS